MPLLLFFLIAAFAEKAPFASPQPTESIDAKFSVLDFHIAKDNHEDILKKLAGISSKCTDKPGLTRKVHVYDCKGGLTKNGAESFSIEKLAPRNVRGKWTGLYLSREESSPLHYVSIS